MTELSEWCNGKVPSIGKLTMGRLYHLHLIALLCIKNINKICCLMSSSGVTLHGVGILFKCCERIEPPGQVQVRLMIMSLASLHVTRHAHFQDIIGSEFA
jgi:hypothetical protein